MSYTNNLNNIFRPEKIQRSYVILKYYFGILGFLSKPIIHVIMCIYFYPLGTVTNTSLMLEEFSFHHIPEPISKTIPADENSIRNSK